MSFEATQMSWLLAMQVKVKARLKNETEQKARDSVCLISGCKCKARSRGLCPRHYMRFRRELLDRPIEERAKFEARQIHLGRILASGQIKSVRNPNPFDMED